MGFFSLDVTVLRSIPVAVNPEEIGAGGPQDVMSMDPVETLPPVSFCEGLHTKLL